jgi:hypothetical protein
MGIETGTALLLSGILGAGGSAASAALGSKKRTTTSTPTWTPQQQHVQGQVGDALQWRLDNPGINLDPLKTSSIGAVNRTYEGTKTRIERDAAARGFERSGTLQRAIRDVDIARGGAIGDLETKFAGMELDQENRILEMAQRYAFAGAGNETTQPGNALGAGIGAGTEAITSLFFLNEMLKRGRLPIGGGADMGNT